MHVYISCRKMAKYPSLECGKICVRYVEDKRVWWYADVVLYSCCIHSKRPRVNCSKHGIHEVNVPGARNSYARFTLGFEEYAMLLCQATAMHEARWIMRISRHVVLNIAIDWAEKAIKEKDLSRIIWYEH